MTMLLFGLFRIETGGDRKATSSFIGGFSVDDGAVQYTTGSGVLSVDSLETGNMSFETDAGIVGWIDLPVATTTRGDIMSYTASLDSIPVLTVFGLTDPSGNVAATSTGIGIGTTTPLDTLNVYGRSVTFQTGGNNSAQAFRILNAATSSVLTVSTVSGSTTFSNLININGVGATSTFAGFINVNGVNSTSTFAGGVAFQYLNQTSGTATNTFATGINLANGCFAVNGTCIITGTPGGSGTVSDGTGPRVAGYLTRSE